MEEKKNIFSRRNIIIAVIAAVVVITGIIVSVVNAGKLNASAYVNVSYSGANGYAVAQCSIDTEKLYNKIAGKEKNMEKLTAYRTFVESVTAKVDKDNVSNGDNLNVTVSYDEEAAKAAGVSLAKTEYALKAAGIAEGKKIALFENVEVVFAGISPEAYVTITNKWSDDYLKNLVFTSDKNSGIKKGDVIKISCAATQQELGRHGYVAETLTIDYTVDSLSSYAELSDINKDAINKISTAAINTIKSQTEDTTFRMLYKATNDIDYLKNVNEEKADNVELIGTYFLKRKNVSEGNNDNYIYLMYKADITGNEESKTVYFAFEYTQGYVTKDKVFDITSDKPEKRYTCSDDYDGLYTSLIGDKESLYLISEVK